MRSTKGGVHALERVVPGLAGVIDGRVVPPVCLVNADVALHSKSLFRYGSVEYSLREIRADFFTHIIPVLGRVDTGS